ncbi:MAG: hypothetical protein GVY19_07430 [Bacteroidetes bacterium]|jgi:type II secretory pathway pseudopilin PulG|nr:hypothetical protein [Bacteroidota bacterium]
MKTVIQIALAVLIVVLGFLLINSIMKPINFKKVQQKRYNATIERLKDIRTAQEAYKEMYGEYTGSFDTLINFIQNDSLPVVRKTSNYNQDSLTEAQAIDLGLVQLDTIKIAVIDSLFGKIKYPVNQMRYVPFTDQAEFNMGAGSVKTGSEVTVPVFEASVRNYILLNDLDQQLAINFNDRWKKIGDGFPGLRVGSLEEATNNAGNWD